MKANVNFCVVKPFFFLSVSLNLPVYYLQRMLCQEPDFVLISLFVLFSVRCEIVMAKENSKIVLLMILTKGLAQ